MTHARAPQPSTPLGSGDLGVLRLIYAKLVQVLARNHIGKMDNKCHSVRYIDGNW